MKYRKKPVIIEAVQFNKEMLNNMFNQEQWLVDSYEIDVLYITGNNELWVKTLEGDHHVSEGDYIIKGVKGEIYPCKPDIFVMTYEPAFEPSQGCSSDFENDEQEDSGDSDKLCGWCEWFCSGVCLASDPDDPTIMDPEDKCLNGDFSPVD